MEEQEIFVQATIYGLIHGAIYLSLFCALAYFIKKIFKKKDDSYYDEEQEQKESDQLDSLIKILENDNNK